ncbi:hypothetical protein MPTK1_2g15030 [Marchantia polymorpha subsp. ruderalis]|uniref:GDSL esterase/lipase n=1 Tax=Marchantia polymorpha TaxID=3197 RepID=A0A2R6X1W1_MARPO|nr:hypothetical protein MARPO_0042s0126 [Marchantia polymorpha]BBN02397.1 hypothetical protein Mp_2g15030 [Marchantia polymorpha subsp. ruderalis]|eukprot:PTQ40093.1 hypothetical protein MARPO_0042s0126 [Marchantia polymorpha]
MGKCSVQAMFCIVALTLLALSGAEASNGVGNGRKFDVPAIFSFGDSTADAGTNTFLANPAFLANFTPYGQTYFHRPTGRFTDGRLWIDFLAQEFGLPVMRAYLDPSFKDYTKGVDFASSGSGNFETTKTMLAAIFGGRTVVNTDEQIRHFRQVKASLIRTLGKTAAARLLARSIYVFSTGSNDISWGYLLNATMQQIYTPDQFTTRIINSLYDSVQELYAEGAKKIVINGLGPIGCLPANVQGNNGSCLEPGNDMTKMFNSKLPALQQRLTLKCPGSFIIFTDKYDFVENIIKNGSEYGFTKGSTACCGTGAFNGDLGACGAVDANGTALYNLCPKEKLGEYVFWDYAHPTEKLYHLVSGIYMNGGTKYMKPFNISQLAHC